MSPDTDNALLSGQGDDATRVVPYIFLMNIAAIFVSQEEARVAASYLESFGIKAIIDQTNALGAMPWLSFGAGHYRLMVKNEDLAAAKRQLSEISPVSDKPVSNTNSHRTILLFLAIVLALLWGFIWIQV